MLGFFVSCALLVHTPLYAVLLAGQVLFYALAGFGAWLNARGRRPAAFYVPFYFVTMNLAAAGGILKFLRGGQTPLWTKAAR
jgi:hypothetical protein